MSVFLIGILLTAAAIIMPVAIFLLFAVWRFLKFFFHSFFQYHLVVLLGVLTADTMLRYYADWYRINIVIPIIASFVGMIAWCMYDRIQGTKDTEESSDTKKDQKTTENDTKGIAISPSC